MPFDSLAQDGKGGAREQGPVYASLYASDGRAGTCTGWQPSRRSDSGARQALLKCSVSGDSCNGCFLNPGSDERMEYRQISFYCAYLIVLYRCCIFFF